MGTGPDSLEGTPGTGAAAGPLPRLGARVIDSLILAVVGAIIGGPMGFGWGWVFVQAVLVFAYFVALDVNWGTTVGKKVLRLRVAGPDGEKPTVQQAATREAFTLFGAVPYLGAALALIAWIVIGATINSSPTKQGKHDELAGGTQVLTV